MGLLTELVLTRQSDERLVFTTSKRKAIFSVAFLASGTLLLLMWFAVKEIFQLLLQRSGSWVDHLIVGTFYAATILYPIFALLFLGYQRRLSLNRKEPGLDLKTTCFGLTLRRRRVPLSLLKELSLDQVLKGKNVAHDDQRLARFQNQGYWQVNAVLHSGKSIALDRNADRKEMVALSLYCERFLNFPVTGLSAEERASFSAFLETRHDATELGQIHSETTRSPLPH